MKTDVIDKDVIDEEAIDEIDNSQNGSKYSRCVLFVCSKPNEENLDETEKQIIDGFKKKWAATNNDPKFDRLNIIYLEPWDKYNSDKFNVLNKIDNYSRIYIIGHCYPGNDSIESEDIYCEEGDDEENADCHEFQYQFLAKTLVTNIVHPKVIYHADNIKQLQHDEQKLKICVATCSSGLDKKNLFGTVIKKSFAEKLMNYLLNGVKEGILVADVVASNQLLLPVPLRGNSLISSLKYLFNMGEPAGDWFHKRYSNFIYYQGNYHLDFLWFIPRHKPKSNYKSLLKLDPDQNPDSLNLNAVFRTLAIKKYSSHEIGEEKPQMPGASI